MIKWYDVVGLSLLIAFAVSHALLLIVASFNGWVATVNFNYLNEGWFELVLSFFMMGWVMWFLIRYMALITRKNKEDAVVEL